jgi:3-deoxy-D-manno-octulosonate 8-phosphate phosphatase (KDO 8-P phosphatase)
MNRDKAKVKARRVKLVLLDVDGVLADGRIVYDQDGGELKSFSARDGAGVKYLQRSGLEVAILSGRTSRAVDVRAEELGISQVYQGVKRKLDVFDEVLKSNGIKPDELAYMGDDLMDLPIMRRAGLSAAPSDAVPEVKRAAHVVMRAGGGRGAVREFAEFIIKAQGNWRKIMERYRE